jgi:hypothetical protein
MSLISLIRKRKTTIMKKNLLVFAAGLLISCSAMTQQARFGFTAGATFANYTSKVYGDDESGDSKAGITVGVLADVPLSKNFSFQPALNFLQKGSKEEETFMGITEKVKLTINCLELPLNLVFNATSNTGTFFIGAGPSFAFNLSGKLKYDDGTDSFSEDIEIGNDPDNDMVKSLDFGINALAGYRFPNGLSLSAGYNAGLSNLYPDDSDNSSLKSHYFSIKLGFMLKGSK